MNKHPKIDRYMVSEEDYELDYITKKFKCTRAQIREAKKLVGNSRRRIYKHLRGE